MKAIISSKLFEMFQLLSLTWPVSLIKEKFVVQLTELAWYNGANYNNFKVLYKKGLGKKMINNIVLWQKLYLNKLKLSGSKRIY